MRTYTTGLLCMALMMGLALLTPQPAKSATVIVDNTDSGFSIISGPWSIRSDIGDYGTNACYKLTSDVPAGTVEWRPSIPTSGTYEVAVWYKSGSNRANNAHFTVESASGSYDAYVDQTQAGSQWVTLGRYAFNAGTSGRVVLTSSAQAGKRVIADAVRFLSQQPVDLTMAVSPPGAGTTTPSPGTSAYNEGDSVPIQATAALGYQFDHWGVSAGASPADTSLASTTVTADMAKTVTAYFVPAQPQFRAIWADAFHTGYKSAAQIDSLVSRAVDGNFNAIVVEVLAYHDTGAGAHGAYWNSAIVPKASDIIGGIDPLEYLVAQAHQHGIEVHCWLVAYRVSTAWPPPGNSMLAQHPEWLMVPRASAGSVATVGGAYTFDPGSPEVQDYLVSIVTELATNYPIDGIHWDYIRYTQADGGYPADMAYPLSGLARFHQLKGRNDLPPVSGDTAWNDFRRQTIDELISRVRGELPLITSNPRQPLRHTAALICFGNAPGSFQSSSAYTLFQNWQMWMQKGWLDGACPMNYKREYDSNQALWYRNWVDAALQWKYNRHMFPGQANYLNTMADSITQLRYCYDHGAEGTVNYSYASTADNNKDGTEEADWGWYPYVRTNLFTSPAPLPAMPWRNPATATEGTLFGRVTSAVSGLPVANATVQISGMGAVQTDGNGYYTVTMIPCNLGEATVSAAVSATGYQSASRSGLLITAGLVKLQNFALGSVGSSPVPVPRIGNLPGYADGTLVGVPGVVTADSSQAGANYIEAADRSSGVRVESQEAFSPGNSVVAAGILSTKPSGERFLAQAYLAQDGPGVMPLALHAQPAQLINSNAVGNGPRTTGLLMRTWGRVISTGAGYFTVNDGSLGGGGLKVDSRGAAAPAIGALVAVTGIVQLEGSLPDTSVLLRPRTSADIIEP